MTKVCSKCKQTKPTTEFFKHKSGKDGINASCKECDLSKSRVNAKQWRQNNPDKVKKWINDNKKHLNEWRAEYDKKKSKSDPTFKVKRMILSQVNTGLNSLGKTKSKASLKIVGLETWSELREHIEKQWEDGMSWDNHGLGPNNTTWHIDHIIPLSSATTEEEVYKLNHYTNLRPMWGSDNIKKGNKK